MKINTFTPEVSLDVDYLNNTNVENIDENNIFLSLLESINEEIAGEFELESFDLEFEDEDKEKLSESDDSTDNLEAMLFGLPPLLQQLNTDIDDSLQQSSDQANLLAENNELSLTNKKVENFSAIVQPAIEAADTSTNDAIDTTKLHPDLVTPKSSDAISEIKNSTVVNDFQAVTDFNRFNQIFNQVGQFINSYTVPVAQLAQTNDQTTNNLTATAASVNNSQYQIQIDRLPTNNQLLEDIVSANIKIYPPELGPVLAKINIQDQSANLLLITQSHAVKHIVESNLAQLHEQFKNADMSVNNIKVEVESRAFNNADQSAHEGQERQPQAENEALSDLDSDADNQSRAKNNVKTSTSIIDTFI